MVHVDLPGFLEQDAMFVSQVSGRRVECPGGVAGGGGQRGLVRLRRGQPVFDGMGVAHLGERLAHVGFQLRAQSGGVERRRVLRLDGEHQFAALDELAFDGEQRSLRIVFGLQGFQLRCDREEFAEKVLQVGTEIEDEGRALLERD